MNFAIAVIDYGEQAQKTGPYRSNIKVSESRSAGARSKMGQSFADPSADAAQKRCDQRAKKQMEESRPHEIFQDKGVEVPHAAAAIIVVVPLSTKHGGLPRCAAEQVGDQQDGRVPDQGADHGAPDSPEYRVPYAPCPGPDVYSGDEIDKEHRAELDEAHRGIVGWKDGVLQHYFECEDAPGADAGA